MQKIINFDFDNFEKLRKRKFPFSYDTNDCKSIEILFFSEKFQGWIIKKFELGILIYSKNSFPVYYPPTRYLYVSNEGYICKLPIFYTSLQIQIPENYNIDQICKKLSDIDKNLSEIIKNNKSADNNEIFKIQLDERQRLESLYDCELLNRIRAKFINEHNIIFHFAI